MTSTTTKLPVPAFEDAVRQLTDYARAYPEYVSQHAYTVLTPQGVRLPFDMIAHAYRDQGGSMDAFAGTRDDSKLPNPTQRNILRLPIVWDYLYDQPAIFLGLSHDEAIARDLMVYWLYGRVQLAQDAGLGWKPALIKALRYLRRLILHPNSGFLVQTLGNHEHLVAPAVAAIDEAIARLKY